MHREQLTAKLVRMIETIHAQRLPARVREFYVFGSYARGALEPGDLDVVVVHDRPPKSYEESLAHLFRGKGTIEQIFKSAARFRGDMGRALRKPGEKVDILLVNRLDEILGPKSKLKREELVLLWSVDDPDYRSKLNAIRLDPAAGRAPRNHIISLKRLNDDLATMDQAVEMVEREELVLSRFPLESIDCCLNRHHAHWLAWWTQCKVMGKESLRLLPYAMGWFQERRQQAEVPDSQCIVWSKSRTHRVHLGRPSLGWMIGAFQASSKVKRQCLIPHIKTGQSNELLVFERGKNWFRPGPSRSGRTSG